MLLTQSSLAKLTAPHNGEWNRSTVVKQTLSLAAILLVGIFTVACQSSGIAVPPVMPQVKANATANLAQNQKDIKSVPDLPSAASDKLTEHSGPTASDGNWESQIRERFEDARVLVEAELDMDLSNVKLLLVSDKPINNEVALETHRLVHKQFDHVDFADNFLDQVMRSQSGTYAALFAARLGAVMVSRSMLESFEQTLPGDRDIRHSALLTLLIHELVHAADDKRYHIHENRALSFRASFAQSATFEGHAQWVTRNICKKVGCLSGLDALDNFMFSRNESNNQLTQPVEAISRNVLEYSYVEGERFISELAKRENGAALIEAVLASPPHDPVQILAPESYPNIERDRLNDRLIQASTQIDHPWVARPWVGVETSPLKGINLRAEPMRRKAAVDGFTRLIQGMVAMQFYDQQKVHTPPMEVTLLQAESAHTARLFARTLHENTFQAEALVNDEPLKISTGAGIRKSQMDMHLYRTQIRAEDPSFNYRTAIGVSGPYVVQIAGNTKEAQTLEDYAIRVLLNLQLSTL